MTTEAHDDLQTITDLKVLFLHTSKNSEFQNNPALNYTILIKIPVNR